MIDGALHAAVAARPARPPSCSFPVRASMRRAAPKERSSDSSAIRPCANSPPQPGTRQRPQPGAECTARGSHCRRRSPKSPTATRSASPRSSHWSTLRVSSSRASSRGSAATGCAPRSPGTSPRSCRGAPLACHRGDRHADPRRRDADESRARAGIGVHDMSGATHAPCDRGGRRIHLHARTRGRDRSARQSPSPSRS